MTIWIFGDSFSTNYKVDIEQSWPEIIGTKLKKQVKNFAHEAVDNFFIYSQYLDQKADIKDDDIVIVQWTNPSRKMFIYNSDNDKHTLEHLSVTRKGRTYFRWINSCSDKWGLSNLKMRSSGVNFFDTWYEDYYDSFETNVNLQAYQNATKKANIIHLYFDEILNYVKENKLYISKDDLHPSAEGHKRLASNIMEKINALYKY